MQKLPDKYQNKYRIPSTRLRSWDYGWNASYFVTICTKAHECYFGEIFDGSIHLSKIGIIVKKYWLEIPQHFSFVKIDAFVIMPNHIHGIIVINKENDGRSNVMPSKETQNIVPSKETQNIASLRTISQPHQSTKNKFSPQSQNLGSIVRGFKIGVTKNARNVNSDFTWQTRYHDHIIRDEKDYIRILNYIENNSQSWIDDKFYN